MEPLRAGLLWASENTVLQEHLPRFRFVRKTVEKFMPGETAEDALTAAQRLATQDGLASTFTRLGENIRDLSQAAEAAGDYLRLLDRIEELGLDAEISLKLTQLGFDLDPGVTSTHVERLVDRCAQLGRTCWIDMESSRYVGPTIELYERELNRSSHVGLALQAYLRRTYDDIQRLLPAKPTIRLVKGAYREPKHISFQGKRAIDESYLRLAGHLAHGGASRIVLGSHDTELIARVQAEISGHARPEISMLYGIRTQDQRQLRAEGHTVRTLISYGPSWYPWFMRRIAEKPVQNTLLALRNLV